MNLLKHLRDKIVYRKKATDEFSAERLRYLYKILDENKVIYDDNRGILIETLRSISEILIWGDKHDSSVIECCYEHGLMTFFLDYLRQPNGQDICVQILQTLNILFQNLRDRMLTDYLLSNNHVNRIITHKFDFSNEGVTAFYFSFLRTLSLLLNKRSINFFFSETEQKFPLYIEAIKFFDHPDRMVRIAIRTITLNVYQLPDPAVQRFILNRTATQYFSNLVWSIRNLIYDFDLCIRQNQNINDRTSLQANVYEYLDLIYYLQDILSLDIGNLKTVLKDQLMNRLFIPVLVFSLIKSNNQLSPNVPSNLLQFATTLFLIVEIFMIINYENIIEELAEIIFSVDRATAREIQYRYNEHMFYRSEPIKLHESLCKSLSIDVRDQDNMLRVVDINNEDERRKYEVEKSQRESNFNLNQKVQSFNMMMDSIPLYTSNRTDEEKANENYSSNRSFTQYCAERPYLNSLIHALRCDDDDDQRCFYSLCFFLAVSSNPCMQPSLLESIGLTVKSQIKTGHNTVIVDRLCDILQASGLADSNIRIVTLTLTIRLLRKLIYNDETKTSYLSFEHMKRVEHSYQRARHDLERYFKKQTVLLDVFEDEYRQAHTDQLKIEDLIKDTSMFYSSTTTPLSGVEFIKRLPSGESERARRSIRVFLMIREFVFELKSLTDNELPLTKQEELFKVNDTIDLNNSDLIACTIHMTDRKEHRFLVIQQNQFILVEREGRRTTWGIVRFCHLVQYVEVIVDKDDSHSLHITVHKPVSNIYAKSVPPVLSAKFTFDNTVQCLTAKNSLIEARETLEALKLSRIESILQFEFEQNKSTSNTQSLEKAKQELFESGSSWNHIEQPRTAIDVSV